ALQNNRIAEAEKSALFGPGDLVGGLAPECGITGIGIMGLRGHEENGKHLHLVALQEELAFDFDFVTRLACQHFRIFDGPLLALLSYYECSVVTDFAGDSPFGRG